MKYMIGIFVLTLLSCSEYAQVKTTSDIGEYYQRMANVWINASDQVSSAKNPQTVCDALKDADRVFSVLFEEMEMNKQVLFLNEAMKTEYMKRESAYQTDLNMAMMKARLETENAMKRFADDITGVKMIGEVYKSSKLFP
ncbi:MAG: hypothetical protein HPY53_03550 [Brevinematales bacterium]|nr:hypothetical protein [Brevinematales bacterium]